MANVALVNYPTANVPLAGVWRLTRAMKAAGWTYLASSDGTNKDTTGNPANDKWGGGTAVGGQTGAAASITAPSPFRGRLSVTGLTGMTANSVGRLLTITGSASYNSTYLISKYVSATSVEIICLTSSGNDANNGSISWTEVDTTAQTYASVTIGANAWILMQGPSTVRIPLTSAPGAFLRGENVSQATTGAEGEIISSYWSSADNAGFLVIAPRVRGTDAGKWGWDGSSTITGGTSGATATPSAAAIEYVREVVFWRASANTTTGTVYYQCVNAASETRFSSQTGAAGCTATIAPGGGGTGNGFPSAGSMVLFGTAGANGTHPNWTGTSSALTYGNAHAMVANAIEASGVSPDGSFTLAFGNTSSINAYTGWGIQRVDDCEVGDVDPYVGCITEDVAFGSGVSSPLTSLPAVSAGFTYDVWSWRSASSAPRSSFRGFRRRGLTTGDAFQDFCSAVLMTGVGNNASGGSIPVSGRNTGSPDAQAVSFLMVKDQIWIVSYTSSKRMRKGTLRWWWLPPAGMAGDMYDGKTSAQLSNSTNDSSAVAMIVGPWDGSSTPANQ